MTLLSIFLDAAPAAPAPGAGSSLGMYLPLLAIGVVFYFFILRPGQKKQKATQTAREALKVGDKIVTAGGIHGRIKEVLDTTFLVEVAENTKIKMEKTSVFVSSEDVPKN